MTGDVVVPPSRPRRRPRFSLRTLLVVVSLSCVGAWFGDRCNRQRATLGLLQGRPTIGVFFAKPWFPYPQFAHDYLATVEEVRLEPGDIPLDRLTAFPQMSRLTILFLPENPQALAKFRQLRELNIKLSKVSDSTLTSVANLRKLETLELFGCEFDPRRLAPLRDASLSSLDLTVSRINDDDLADLPTTLVSLDIGDTPITDEGLARLPTFARLKKFAAANTKITDAGLRHLRRFDLQSLDVTQTEITDVGLREISQMSHLQELRIGRTEITDDCAADLTRLRNLRILCVQRTRLSNRFLACLSELKNLRELNLEGTDMNNAGLPSLAVLRDCEVIKLPIDQVTEFGAEWLRTQLGRDKEQVGRFLRQW